MMYVNSMRYHHVNQEPVRLEHVRLYSGSEEEPIGDGDNM